MASFGFGNETVDVFNKKISENLDETELLDFYYPEKIIQINRQALLDYQKERDKYIIKRNLNKYDSRLGNCVIYKNKKFLGLFPYKTRSTSWLSVLYGERDGSKFYKYSSQDQDIEVVVEAAELYLMEHIFEKLKIPHKSINWDHRYSF